MSMCATILGCGSSGGVPRIGNHWGDCDPANPKNRRRRCALLVSKIQADRRTNILIDTGPDMRDQLLDVGVSDIDAVFYTHEHADHVHGIDDLRVLAIQNRRRMDVYFHPVNAKPITSRFAYCFETPKGSPYPPILNGHEFDYHTPIPIEGNAGQIHITAFPQEHGNIRSSGFRVKGLAYSSDLHDIPKESYDILSGLDVWIVDALRREPHSTHFHLEETLSWIDYFKPRKAILTNMHIDLDYATLCKELPAHVRPAYDNMKIDF